MRIPSLLLMVTLTLGACAYLGGRDADRERSEARADHSQCAAHPHEFPSADYTTCRRELADQRQQRHWLELSLAQQQSRAVTPDYVPQPPVGVYRSIDPARFTCEQFGTVEEPMILCRER